MVRVTWSGLDDLIDALDAAPATLTASSHHAIDTAAEDTQRELLAGYPIGPTGHLRGGVRLDKQEGAATYSAAVISAAPHAHLWESGTRQRVDAKGSNRGRVHPHREQGVVAIGDRHRRAMELELIDVVRSLGFDVIGGFA